MVIEAHNILLQKSEWQGQRMNFLGHGLMELEAPLAEVLTHLKRGVQDLSIIAAFGASSDGKGHLITGPSGVCDDSRLASYVHQAMKPANYKYVAAFGLDFTPSPSDHAQVEMRAWNFDRTFPGSARSLVEDALALLLKRIKANSLTFISVNLVVPNGYVGEMQMLENGKRCSVYRTNLIRLLGKGNVVFAFRGNMMVSTPGGRESLTPIARFEGHVISDMRVKATEGHAFHLDIHFLDGTQLAMKLVHADGAFTVQMTTVVPVQMDIGGGARHTDVSANVRASQPVPAFAG